MGAIPGGLVPLSLERWDAAWVLGWGRCYHDTVRGRARPPVARIDCIWFHSVSRQGRQSGVRQFVFCPTTVLPDPASFLPSPIFPVLPHHLSFTRLTHTNLPYSHPPFFSPLLHSFSHHLVSLFPLPGHIPSLCSSFTPPLSQLHPFPQHLP